MQRYGGRLPRFVTAALAIVLAFGGALVAAQPAAAAQCSDSACVNVPTSKLDVAADLVDYVNSGKLVIPSAYPGILPNELQAIANGTVSSRCDVDVRALQTILIVVRHFGSATITDLNRDCSGGTDATCPGSPVHCVEGNGGVPTTAIDFGSIQGLGGPSASSAAALFSFIATFVPQVTNGAWTEALCGESAVSPYMHQFFVSGAGCDHHHIDFRGTSSPLNIPAGSSAATFDLTAAGVMTDTSAVGKTGVGSTWTTLTTGTSSMSVVNTSSGPVFALLQTNGTVLTKVGLAGTWTTQITGAKSVALAADPTNGVSLAVILTSGSLQAKTGLGAPWIALSTGVADAAIASDSAHGVSVAAVTAAGGVIVKNGLYGAWTQITTGAAAVRLASDSANGQTVVVLTTSGTVIGKTGFFAPWYTLTSNATAIDVASDPTNGPFIGAIAGNGDMIVKTALGAPWTTVLNSASSLSVSTDPVRGLSMAGVQTNGAGRVKTGVGAPWTTILTGAKSLVLAK